MHNFIELLQDEHALGHCGHIVNQASIENLNVFSNKSWT